jgi:hypothetical protein
MSFFRGLIEILIGDLGRSLLAFYRANSTVINVVVFIYGMILLYAHNNLRRAMQRLEWTILEIAKARGDSPDPEEIQADLLARWQEQEAGKRVLIPSRTDLWVGFIDLGDMPALLHIRPEYVKMALHKLVGKPGHRAFSPIAYRVWSEYRHRLMTGLRSRVKDPDVLLKAYREQAEREKALKKR